MKRYKVVAEKHYLCSDDISYVKRMFEMSVEEYLNKGWILAGGVSVTLSIDKYIIFSQALYLED